MRATRRDALDLGWQAGAAAEQHRQEQQITRNHGCETFTRTTLPVCTPPGCATDMPPFARTTTTAMPRPDPLDSVTAVLPAEPCSFSAGRLTTPTGIAPVALPFIQPERTAVPSGFEAMPAIGPPPVGHDVRRLAAAVRQTLPSNWRVTNERPAASTAMVPGSCLSRTPRETLRPRVGRQCDRESAAGSGRSPVGCRTSPSFTCVSSIAISG